MNLHDTLMLIALVFVCVTNLVHVQRTRKLYLRIRYLRGALFDAFTGIAPSHPAHAVLLDAVNYELSCSGEEPLREIVH